MFSRTSCRNKTKRKTSSTEALLHKTILKKGKKDNKRKRWRETGRQRERERQRVDREEEGEGMDKGFVSLMMVMCDFNCVDQWFSFRDKLQKSDVELYEDTHVLGPADAQIIPRVILRHCLPHDPMWYFSKQELCITCISKNTGIRKRGCLLKIMGPINLESLGVRSVRFYFLTPSAGEPDDSQSSVAPWPCTL